ncbi:PNP-UDP-1 domain-containing protein [Aphelenchoides fujianensis]|nr:PNP-UDP-1 domain-containing protein [Aphelenchoides fujianensis]
MPFHLHNPHLNELPDDTLYHFGFSKSNTNFKEFSDVRFACIGGSASRLKMYAEAFGRRYGCEVSENLSRSDRFCLYKTGGVLWANHGMGVPSLSIMLNELFKLLHYAGVEDLTIIRLGTSGGVGIEPGTVVITNGTLNSKLREEYELEINGRTVAFECPLDQQLWRDLSNVADDLKYTYTHGKTLCANDFYEGQMRLDGCFYQGEQDDKMEFLRKIQALGVKNIEMECTGFAAMTHRVGARAGIVCVALLNRMEGDQVRISEAAYKEFELRPFHIVSTYIANQLGYSPILNGKMF